LEEEHRRHNLKEVLTELKDTTELMLDLAYSSILFDEKYFGGEVMELEDRVDDLINEAGGIIISAARGMAETEDMVRLLRVLSIVDKMAEAASDIAEIKLTGIGLPSHFLKSMNLLEETIAGVTIEDGMKACGKSVSELENETKMVVLALKHEGRWSINPSGDRILLAGDRIIVKGPFDALDDFEAYIYGRSTIFPPEEELNEPEEFRSIRETIVEMKNYSELAVDLAYSSMLFRDEGVSEEVGMLESRLDSLRKEIEEMVLRYAKRMEDPTPLAGVLHIAWSCERVSDAALELAESSLRSELLSALLSEAFEESEEILTRIEIPKGSRLEGKSMAELDLEGETGAQIMAIRKAGGKRWIYYPKGDIPIEAGDVLIIKGEKGFIEGFMKELKVSKLL